MVLTTAVCSALLVAGCGGSQGVATDSTEVSASASASTETRPPPPPPKQESTHPRKRANRKPLVARKPEPHIVAPDGPPPKKHVISRDLKEGRGTVAHTGDVITVDFHGAYYETGEVLMSSWERNELFIFQLGGGKGILGWEHALQGMRVGGRRELILPARLTSRYLRPSEERSQIYVLDLRRVE